MVTIFLIEKQDKSHVDYSGFDYIDNHGYCRINAMNLNTPNDIWTAILQQKNKGIYCDCIGQVNKYVDTSKVPTQMLACLLQTLVEPYSVNTAVLSNVQKEWNELYPMVSLKRSCLFKKEYNDVLRIWNFLYDNNAYKGLLNDDDNGWFKEKRGGELYISSYCLSEIKDYLSKFHNDIRKEIDYEAYPAQPLARYGEAYVTKTMHDHEREMDDFDKVFQTNVKMHDADKYDIHTQGEFTVIDNSSNKMEHGKVYHQNSAIVSLLSIPQCKNVALSQELVNLHHSNISEHTTIDFLTNSIFRKNKLSIYRGAEAKMMFGDKSMCIYDNHKPYAIVYPSVVYQYCAYMLRRSNRIILEMENINTRIKSARPITTGSIFTLFQGLDASHCEAINNMEYCKKHTKGLTTK